MSDFILMGMDYIDFIKTDEDLVKFNRMKEIEGQIKGVPANKCLNKIIEHLNLDRELRGMPPVKVIQLPPNPQLN